MLTPKVTSLGKTDIMPTPQAFLATFSLWRHFLLRLGFPVSVGWYQLPGWRDSLEFFLFRCFCGRLHVDYKHGHRQYLNCLNALRSKVSR